MKHKQASCNVHDMIAERRGYIKVDAEVNSIRRVGDVYELWIYVGDYEVMVSMTPRELNTAMGVKSF